MQPNMEADAPPKKRTSDDAQMTLYTYYYVHVHMAYLIFDGRAHIATIGPPTLNFLADSTASVSTMRHKNCGQSKKAAKACEIITRNPIAYFGERSRYER